jgi:hypothetical protein
MRRRLTRLTYAAIVLGLIVPAPASAAWWVVRSSDEKCLVVDVEPTPGDKGVTRLGKTSYQTERDAQKDLSRLCPEAGFTPSEKGAEP